MEVAYFSRLTRAENARCERHRARGYGSAYGVGCVDCYAVQREVLAFQRAQRTAVAGEQRLAELVRRISSEVVA